MSEKMPAGKSAVAIPPSPGAAFTRFIRPIRGLLFLTSSSTPAPTIDGRDGNERIPFFPRFNPSSAHSLC
jgi:hypothetical protein